MNKFTALSDPNRRDIIEMLAVNGALPVKQINDRFKISPPAVSQHLKILREASLISVEKRAQQRIYSVNPDGMEEIWEWMNNMRRFWTDRLDILEDLLKQENTNHKRKDKTYETANTTK